LLEREAIERLARACDDVMAAGCNEATGGDAADAAKPDHCYSGGTVRCGGRGHSPMVG
jgi:hypothetical protein